VCPLMGGVENWQRGADVGVRNWCVGSVLSLFHWCLVLVSVVVVGGCRRAFSIGGAGEDAFGVGSLIWASVIAVGCWWAGDGKWCGFR